MLHFVKSSFFFGVMRTFLVVPFVLQILRIVSILDVCGCEIILDVCGCEILALNPSF